MRIPYPGILDQIRPKVSEVSFIENGQRLNRLAGRGVALADFDGDGSLDAIVVNQSSPEGAGHRVYFGDGHGRFRNGPTLANPSNGYGAKPVAADVNGDGSPDIVTGGAVWLNDGHGQFTLHPEVIENRDAGQLTTVQFSDVNGDGHTDLVAIADWRALRVCLNDGEGHFRDTDQRLGAGVVGALALADVNGDGAVDALTGGWRSDRSAYCPTRLWLNDGNGRFRDSGQVFDQDGNHVHGIALERADHRPPLGASCGAGGLRWRRLTRHLPRLRRTRDRNTQ